MTPYGLLLVVAAALSMTVLPGAAPKTPAKTVAPAQLDEREKADGFVALFNGVDLTGWKQYASKKDAWVVEDGLLVCKSGGGGLVGTTCDYADFELRLEDRLKPCGNSGVDMRVPEP